jgi:polysaccharide pyruvyl transferase WcaK-like protein
MSHNLGEHLVIKCSEYLLQRAAPGESFQFTECDLYGRIQRTARLYTPSRHPAFGCSKDPSRLEKLVRRVVQKGKRMARGKTWRDIFARLEWKTDPNYAPRVRAYYRDILRDADLVMFAGGGIIEYSYNRYQDAIELIVREARRANKPVVFLAVGLVGECDAKSYKFRTMRRALLSPNVKMITVRDHVDWMNDRYLQGIKTARLVADTAVWASEAFGIMASPRPVIGVGLVRENAFESYSRPIPYENLVELYRALLAELTARGCEWRLFGNGFENDQEFGEKLLAQLGMDQSLLLPRPTECGELLKTIAGFQGIITFRLHACISAYSMGVPSVVISWNDKVDDFMKTIGFPERALSGDRANAREIVNQMERAISTPYAEEARAAYRKTILDSVGEAYRIGGGA